VRIERSHFILKPPSCDTPWRWLFRYCK
jgi:hypothetical protein